MPLAVVQRCASTGEDRTRESAAALNEVPHVRERLRHDSRGMLGALDG
jgi:hypothetical protein